jgi:hypothetical protein
MQSNLEVIKNIVFPLPPKKEIKNQNNNKYQNQIK